MKSSLHKLIHSEYEISLVQSDRIRFLGGGSVVPHGFAARIDEAIKESLTTDERLQFYDLSEREAVATTIPESVRSFCVGHSKTVRA